MRSHVHLERPGSTAPYRPRARLWSSFCALLLCSLLALSFVPQAQAAALSKKPPHKLTAAQIQAIHQQLKQQIHVKHSGHALTPAGIKQGGTPIQPIRPQVSGLPAYNNIGISDPNTRTVANFDGNKNNHSYQAQALQDVGLMPGITITSQNVTFIWPSVATAQADNYAVNGQTIVIPVTATPGATTVGLLGASTGNASGSSGTATLTYTDSTTSTFTLDFTDWWNGSLQPGNAVAVSMDKIDTRHGTKSGTFDLYSFVTSLNTSKTLQSVTLPTNDTGGQLHVFAVGVSGPALNNVGISDDARSWQGNYDAAGHSYALQMMASDDLVPGQQFDADGIAYSWPNVAGGSSDNFQASGQVLPVIPVPNATTLGLLGSATNGSASGTATLTYTDGSTQSFTLGFSDWAASSLSFGNQVVVHFPSANGPTGGWGVAVNLYAAEITLQSGKTLQSVTLPSTVTGGQLHVFTIGTRSTLNNLAFSNDSQPGGGNMDNSDNSYSVQALESVGITPGQPFAYDGTLFTLPASYGSLADNDLVNGQVLAVTPVPNATTLIVLGAADYNNETGTATITYTDNSTQTFTLSLSDWQLGGNTQPVAFGNGIAATMSYLNTPAGKQAHKAYIFSTEVSLQPAKTVQSLTLPTTISPSSGQMHVFAVGTRSQYNNTGLSDDSNSAGANFDGINGSYSEEDFQNPNVAGWNPGDTLTYEGINYVWPGVPAGQADNFQAQGQVLPISSPAGATTLGLVGAATNAGSSGASGTATLTYTDGTTSTFTLTLSDWMLGGNNSTFGPVSGNRLFALLPHENTLQGQVTVNTYLFEVETPLNASKQLQSVTLPSSVTGGQIHVFMLATRTGENYPNNIGTSDDSDTLFANFDGAGHSYSIEALEAAGLSEGQPFTYNGVTFTWPASYSVIPDNYQAAGQIIPAAQINGPLSEATAIAFLGAAANGSASGTVTISYTDGSTSIFTLSFGDWQGLPQSGDLIPAMMNVINSPSGQQTLHANLYYAETVVTAGKTIQSVTLPTTVTGGQLHVFAVGTRNGNAPSSVYGSTWQPAAWRNANGTQEVFERQNDGNIWYDYQSTANGPWIGWTPLQSGMQFTSNPVVGLTGTGVLRAFARGTDNTIWTNWETAPNSTAWNGWVPLQSGSSLTFQGNPSLAYNGDGRMSLFARGSDGNVYWNSETSVGGSWNGWSVIQAGKQFSSDPVGGRIGSNGVIQLFVRGTDNGIWSTYQSAANSTTWVSWGPAFSGFSFQGTPAIDYMANGDMTVFAHGIDNNIWAIWETCLNCGWTSWAALQSGQQFNGDVEGGTIQVTNGVEQIFARGSDNTLRSAYQTSGNSSSWNAWGPAANGLTFQGTPAIDYTSDGRMQVYMLGSDNRLWTTYETVFNGAWSVWAVV